jgi:16S rRNA (guanine527-N7)-methyltransferase
MTLEVLPDGALAEALDQGLEALGLPLAPDARVALLGYVGLLAKWNRTYNLTAIREPARMVTHHVIDSLAVLGHLDDLLRGIDRPRILDVGSGAGLPGIPLAVARPDWDVAMLEPVHKKSTFITQALAELGIANARAVAQRVEDYRTPEPAAIAISRAFSDLASFAECAARHVAQPGVLVAMKGVHPDEELRELPDAFEVVAVAPLAVPGVDAARHVVVMRSKAAA